MVRPKKSASAPRALEHATMAHRPHPPPASFPPPGQLPLPTFEALATRPKMGPPGRGTIPPPASNDSPVPPPDPQSQFERDVREFGDKQRRADILAGAHWNQAAPLSANDSDNQSIAGTTIGPRYDDRADSAYPEPPDRRWEGSTLPSPDDILAKKDSHAKSERRLAKHKILGRFQIPVEHLICSRLTPKFGLSLKMLKGLDKLVWLCKDKEEVNRLLLVETGGKPLKFPAEIFAAYNMLQKKDRKIQRPGAK